MSSRDVRPTVSSYSVGVVGSLSPRALESFREIRALYGVHWLNGVRRPMPDTHLLFNSRPRLNQQSPLLLAILEGDAYRAVPSLANGDLGAVALGATNFPAQANVEVSALGWIGTGSNRFGVRSVVLVDGVVFHLGRCEAGGFHEDKPHGLRVVLETFEG